MPAFRAPFLVSRGGALKAGIIKRKESSLYIMPGIRAPILLVKKESPKSWHNNKERILPIYYARF